METDWPKGTIWEPTRDNQIFHARELLRKEGLLELRRHAMVAIDNRCTCNECFCCAARHVMREYAAASPPVRKMMLGK